MKKYDSSKAIISIHVPKCAGTSLKQVLKAWFGDCLYYNYVSEKNGKYPVKLAESYIKQPICIHGHFNKERGIGVDQYYPNVSQFFTFLRDPIESQISFFYFQHFLLQKGKLFKDGRQLSSFTKDIDDFFESSKSIFLMHLPKGINQYNYKKFMEEKFVHIGVVEEYQKSIKILAEKLGKDYNFDVPWINKTKKVKRPSESVIRKFKEKNTLECKIYEFAVEKFNLESNTIFKKR